MKRLIFTLSALVIAGCGRQFTGLGSVDIEVTSITFHDSHPATITGILQTGKPADFVKAADSPLIRGIDITGSQHQDSAGLAAVNEVAGYPVSWSEGYGESASIELLQDGMTWIPHYRYVEENGTRTVYATASLTNMTIQTWQADTVRFLAPDRSLVTAATGRITVRQGESSFPWWNASAGRQNHVIRYGWPIPGRWNQLIAVICPNKGLVESWTGQVFESGDTLFFPADSLLDLSLEWEQGERDFQCFLTASSTADQQIEWTFLWPERLPRGARVEPGPDTVQIQPGQSVTVLYKEVY